MQSTQLSCPHCGSTLNFGMEIVEGTPVECLICMRTFGAANPVAVPCHVPVKKHENMRSIDAVEMPTLSDAVTDTFPKAAEPVVPGTVETKANTPSVEEPPPVEMAASEASAAAVVPTTPDMPKVGVLGIDAAETPTLPDLDAKPIETTPKAAASVKRVPKGEVLVSKPYSAPLAGAIAEKAKPKPPPADKANPSVAAQAERLRRQRDESALAGKVVMTVAAFGLLFLLTGGIAIAAWRITVASRTGAGPESDEPKVVANSKVDTSNNPNKKPAEEEDDADLRKKIQDEVKQVLLRKDSAKPGVGDPEIDPISNVNFSKQSITGLDQQKINAAIEKGVAYLKQSQNANGTWASGHGVGYAAIGGLTLLECDTPAKDPAVQRAAAFVRAHTAKLNSTYELSLAVLFLDRLGDSRDRPLIQGMALRLLAGQNDCGGWTYTCPPLSPKDMFQLYAFLQSNKEPNFLNPLGGGNPKTQSGIVVNPKRDPAKLDDPFQQLNELILTQAIEAKSTDPKKGGVIPPVGTDPNTSVIAPVGIDPKVAKPNPDKPAVKPIRPETLPVNLQNLPIVKNQGLKKAQVKKGKGGGDNSNTQFAMLALWAARRHGVPTDQALVASYQRFMNPQNADGGWGYFPGNQSTNTMTNVGLLGLAMGHGAAPEIVAFNPKNPKDIIIKPALQDSSIQSGLHALSRHIGQPSTDPNKTQFTMQNLYFLWSVERVAMLYDLKTIAGKDWYGWGAQILVHNQQAAGDWPTAHYHGASAPLNTCFALLFLRRSNLVQDLTNNLRLNTGIADVEK